MSSNTTSLPTTVIEQRAFPVFGVISLWFGVIMVVTTFFGQFFYGTNIVWQDLFDFSMRLLLIAFTLASLGHLALHARHSLALAVLPLLINLGSIMIIFFVPFENMRNDVLFALRWRDYDEAIERIELGEIQADSTGYAQLPADLAHLSAYNGRILIDESQGNLQVFFFESYVSASEFTGYLYRADDAPPQVDVFNRSWWQLNPKQPHWFFGSTH